jgi:hypothetical protein
VLEIASGTGQHAVHFGAHLPHVTWQTSELSAHHAGIMAWLAQARLPNVAAPLELDVNGGQWPDRSYDAVFSANTLHIIAWTAVERMFAGIARVLATGGLLVVYGPFKFAGRPLAESNAQFDAWLRSRDAASGIRDQENVDALARSYGFALEHDIEMPANNRTLVWRRLRPDAG